MSRVALTPSQVYAEVAEIYEGRASGLYGLSLVTQRAHALQSAFHARTQCLPASLIVACLLHDVGHMIHGLGEHPAAEGIDDRHEALGADWLARRFGASVSEPVRLHVAAKRYLCAAEPDYTARLSRDSIESLALQGGPMSPDEMQAFRRQTHWQDAVALRRIDERAKDPQGPAPVFSDFAPEILQCAGVDQDASTTSP